MTPTRMPAAEGPTAAVRRLLANLLDRDLVDAVLVQMVQPRTGLLTHALVSSSEMLAQAQPLAPARPVNAARLVSKLSAQEPSQRIAAVLRPCEERCLTELVKLRQASLDHVYPIVFDCPGACPRAEVERLEAGPDGLEGAAAVMLGAAHEPEAPGPELLPGCAICTDFVPGVLADITLEFYGHPEWIGVGLSDRLAPEEMKLDELGLEPQSDVEERDSRLEALTAERAKARDAALAEMNAMRARGSEGLTDLVAGCIRCGNCQRACPICFCRRCTFEMPAFEYVPEHFLRDAAKRGAARMPEDAVLFHLTRLAHVALSCTSCGACEAACPQGIELTKLFTHVGGRVRKPFGYEAGRSLDEPLPLSTFEQEELEPR